VPLWTVLRRLAVSRLWKDWRGAYSKKDLLSELGEARGGFEGNEDGNTEKKSPSVSLTPKKDHRQSFNEGKRLPDRLEGEGPTCGR